MTNLLEHVRQSICRGKLLSRGQRILVAVSGGLDSVVMLHLLHHLAATHRWKLIVAHFNHRLRGSASAADEKFVRNLANQLKCPCVVGRASVRTHAKHRKLSIEMAARQYRHEFLAQSAKRLGISTVALAHHADDQVELFFLRLLRGAGCEGLAGMKWRSPSPGDANVTLVRPLLDVGGYDLEVFARGHRLRFREDASNASCDILRNRVRHELLPLLRRRFQPALDQTVLRAMDLISAEAEIVTEATWAWLTRKRRLIANCPLAVQRRIIQLQLRKAGIADDYALIESLRSKPRKRITVRPGLDVELAENGLLRRCTSESGEFDPEQKGLALKGRAGEQQFDGVCVRWRIVGGANGRQAVGRPGWESFDADRVGNGIVLRHWRPGDRYQPIGLPATVKLQDWFTNRKIPRAQRRALVVAATLAGEIFWIEGERISERFKLTRETKRRLIWRWQRA